MNASDIRLTPEMAKQTVETLPGAAGGLCQRVSTTSEQLALATADDSAKVSA